jgi:hypothetical protein
MNLFFLLTAIALARGENAPADSRRPEMWAAMAGLCAVSAFFTKVHLMALWPFVAAAALAFGFRVRPRHTAKRRSAMLGAYLAAAVLAAALYSASMDWRYFLACWRQLGVNEHGVAPSMFALLDMARATTPASLMPWLDRSRCFFLFEGLAALALALGAVRFVRRRWSSPRLMMWMAAYSGVVIAVWFYRSKGNDFHGFHYLFPAIAAFAPLVAMGIESLVSKAGHRPALMWTTALLLLHAPGAWAVWESKQQDALEFRESRTEYYFAALKMITTGERIAVIGAEARAFHGLSDKIALPTTLSRLLRALDATFVWERGTPAHGAFRRRS